MKKVIAACIDQILQFDSQREVDRFLNDLTEKKQVHSVIWQNIMEDKKVRIRIKRQYNNHFMSEAEGGE